MQSGMLEGAGSSATEPGALGRAVKQTCLSPFIWKQNEIVTTELSVTLMGTCKWRAQTRLVPYLLGLNQQ